MPRDIEQLDIWIEGTRVGALTFDENDLFGLSYDPAWVSSVIGFPISPRLPFKARAGTPAALSATVRRFFENLLPEGQALDDAVQASGLSKANLFGILRVLGRESAGAMVLLPPGTTPEVAATQANLREISYQELSQRIRETPRVPFSVWDGKVRMSIAGYQNKLAVRVDQTKRIWLVDGVLASTHILKPQANNATPHQAINEYFCMRLIQAAGIASAPVDIIRVPEPVLVVGRFDRQLVGQTVHRVHIIDACQALDMPAAYKYERNYGSGRDVMHIREGVSFKRLFSIQAFAANPAAMIVAQLRWAIVQYVIGNSDAHGKNMSFFLTRQGLKVAPAYDQLCVKAYAELDQEFAMAIGDQFNAEEVRVFDWADFATQCGIGLSLLGRELRRGANAITKALPEVLQDPVFQPEERDFLAALSVQIVERVERLKQFAPQVPKMAGMFTGSSAHAEKAEAAEKPA